MEIEMNKRIMKPGTLLYPVPAVMVSVGTNETQNNIITIAWTGTINSDPPMAYISVRKERHSYNLLKKTGHFVINIATKNLAYETDFCGVKSGRDIDKFKYLNLTPITTKTGKSVLIEESPLNIECEITNILELGSHDMFIGKVINIYADETMFNDKDSMLLNEQGLITYSHGKYFELGNELGKFGYSIQKRNKK
jgi:flavin reductase (DIM6/NTAB) family NADH-FMN oxidoreductase RutF